MVYHFGTLSDNSGAHAVIIPVPDTKKLGKKIINQAKTQQQSRWCRIAQKRQTTEGDAVSENQN